MPQPEERARCRIGVVGFLNARPLVHCLPQLAPEAEIVSDVPSRLADGLAAGRFDVAMIPSIEYFRSPGYAIVSDACIACDGPVRSVRLFSRVATERIRTLALADYSRTSAALTQILLREQFGLRPEILPLPLGTSPDDGQADAVMLIGDPALCSPRGPFAFVWDLGERWTQWTGLPFVFAMWIARRDADLRGLKRLLESARDQGLTRLEEIARQEAAAQGLTETECLVYLRDNLKFRLGQRQREGLQLFYDLAVRHGLAPPGVELVFSN